MSADQCKFCGCSPAAAELNPQCFGGSGPTTFKWNENCVPGKHEFSRHRDDEKVRTPKAVCGCNVYEVCERCDPETHAILTGQRAEKVRSEGLRTREGDQPLPLRRDDLPAIQDLVIAEIEARKAVGLKRYGQLLKAHDGRDALQDAYEEAMDLTIYLRKCIYERDGK